MKYHAVRVHSSRMSLGILVIAAAGILSLQPVDAIGQTGKWATVLDNIKSDYYTKHQPQKAIQGLEDAIATNGNTYSNDDLSDILTMVEDYFAKTKEDDRFEKLVFAMLEPDRVNQITNKFNGTPLSAAARKAKENFLRPVTARLRVDSGELEIGESAKITYSGINSRKIDIGKGSLEIKLSPEYNEYGNW